MTHDFDTVRSLRGRHIQKYDNIRNAHGHDAPDMIGMGVADMDFTAAPAILQVLRDEIEFGYMGYFTDPLPVSEAVAKWLADRHGWQIDPSWARYTHGVVSGYAGAIEAYSRPGDGVILFSPVYASFFGKIEAMARDVVESPMILRDGQYHMDLETLGTSLKGHEKLVTLCSPHNPGGRLWTADELRALAAFCAEHDLMLISDEIHMDLCFPGARHTPTAVAAPEHLDRLIVLTAASKGFNIAGLETGILIAPHPDVRARVDKVLRARESTPNRFGMLAIREAFGACGDWSDAVRAYLAENFRVFSERMNALPGVSVLPMQSTYLAWADFTGTGMSDDELKDRILHKARVATQPGTWFRTGGSGHQRFNLALPRARLVEALDRIEAAFSDLQ